LEQPRGTQASHEANDCQETAGGGLGVALGGLIGVQFGALGCVLGTLGGGLVLGLLGAAFGGLIAAVRAQIDK
jgi:hypothetical protein